MPAPGITVLTGPNGAGKTNLLEAISLLAPGRGLRHARLADLPRRDGPGTWAVAAQLDHEGTRLDLGTGTDTQGAERRRLLLNGETPRSTADIAALATPIWLTPQMDRLFQESASGRRRFLDRLVWALEPGHARQTTAHDAALAERNRLLARGHADPAWLAGLEAAIARHGVALAAARATFARRLNARPWHASTFPRVHLQLNDQVAQRLDQEPALATEAWLRDTLATRRPTDAAAGTTTIGAHRADMTLHDADTNLPADRASTGEQRAMLVSLVLSHAALIAEARGTPPTLLLDEAGIHLDPSRRAALFDALATGGAQTFLTGTEETGFEALKSRAMMVRVEKGTVLV